MAEKTGGLEKMKYDFPTEAVLEVQIKGTWYRVTSREFRSFDGNRRFTKPQRQPGLGLKDSNDIIFDTYEYNGPLYLYGSNKVVEPLNNEQIVNSPYYDKTKKISGDRS